MTKPRARAGWESSFPEFQRAHPRVVRERLNAFVPDASEEQLRAWSDSIPPLQTEVGEVLRANAIAQGYSAILEYELPMESRRPDVVLLVGAGVMVLELKGKVAPSQGDLDQAAAYARDLTHYHRECAGRTVVPVLVPTRARGYQSFRSGVHVTGPDAVDELVTRIEGTTTGAPIDRDRFLDADAYCPLPTLVEAARELFTNHDVRWNPRARAATEPAMEAITAIIQEAAATKTRHLVLVTGVPGSGKTLVGLRTVHSRFLEDLAIPRAHGMSTAHAVFLSGNGPLVEVLQYELGTGGGEGKAFVRGVKEYVKRYSRRPDLCPPEHVLVFDEAQRAYDSAMVAKKHPGQDARSEPELFIEFAERIPDWCVVVGLVGTGQEIHIGEEGGLVQWKWAVEQSPRRADWVVHAPPAAARAVQSPSVAGRVEPRLSLDAELRFHAAQDLHAFVGGLLAGDPPGALGERAARLENDGYHLRITQDLDAAKSYLRDRYAGDGGARFGIVASSRDRDLVRFGIPNDYQSTKRMRLGPWYGDDEDGYDGRSCRRLADCVTEFGAQGLELDGALVAWGTDLVWTGSAWSNAAAAKYKDVAMIRDALQLRINAYRVLLTRARDGFVIFCPPAPVLAATYSHLIEAGVRPLA